MAKNDFFKKKELNRKDYAGKEKTIKTVKEAGTGVAISFGLFMIVKNLLKKTIFRG